MSEATHNSIGTLDAADPSRIIPSLGSVDMPQGTQTAAASDQPPLDSAERPTGWEDLRGNDDIQFEPIVPIVEVNEPSWLAEALRSFFDVLGSILAPIGGLFGASWAWLQWVLLALAVAFLLYMAVRTFGPLARKKAAARTAISDPEWAPSAQESIALLEDADKLAAQGRFDEATHLLLQRSVSHISAARPDWVEPSSTARELAALPALSQTARRAFGTIAEQVERSLFALRSLDRSDWETARAAYANFAEAAIEAAARPTGAGAIAQGRAR